MDFVKAKVMSSPLFVHESSSASEAVESSVDIRSEGPAADVDGGSQMVGSMRQSALRALASNLPLACALLAFTAAQVRDIKRVTHTHTFSLSLSLSRFRRACCVHMRAAAYYNIPCTYVY